MKQSKRYDSLDAMRLLAAVLVASLHTGVPLGLANNYIADIARIAVPFFLMCSGYFLYSEDYGILKFRVTRSIRKSISLLAKSTLVYIVLDIVLRQNVNEVIAGLSNYLTIDFWLLNSTPFMPVGWYLMAFIYSSLLVLLLCRICHTPNWTWLIMICVCFAFWMLTGTYQAFFFMPNTFPLSYNCCWLVAYPWLLIGMFFRYFVDHDGYSFLQKYRHIALLLVFVGIIITFSEHFLIKNVTKVSTIGSGYLGTILTSICLFQWLLCNKTICSWGGYLGRKYSMDIYLYHVAFNYILSAIFGVKFNWAIGGWITLPFDYTLVINCLTTSFLAAIFPSLLTKLCGLVKNIYYGK